MINHKKVTERYVDEETKYTVKTMIGDFVAVIMLFAMLYVLLLI